MVSRSKQGQKSYDGGIVAGSLLVPESRGIARLLLEGGGRDAWRDAIITGNILQKRSPQTSKRQGSLILKRLLLMKPDHWQMVSEGHAALATQAVMAAAIKHSHLIGDFMQSVVREHWQTFKKSISNSDWHHFMENCSQLDPRVEAWTEKTRAKLKQVVFRILAEAGYIQSTKSRLLQPVSIDPELRKYLDVHSEAYVLRCMSATE